MTERSGGAVPLPDEPLPARLNMARYCLEMSAGRTPDKAALILARPGSGEEAPFAGERWTYAEIEDAVKRIASGLLALGLVRGDRVMIRMENRTAYALVHFAGLAAGLVSLPSASLLTEPEARFLLEDSEARALVVSPGYELCEPLPRGVTVIDAAEVERWRREMPRADYADTAADDPAFLVYSSGTTGRPKGVLHGHRHAWGRRPMYQGWYGLSAEDRLLHAGAFNWTYTLGVGLSDPWAMGATAILYNGPPDPTVWPRLVKHYRATLFATVPGLYRQILKYSRIGPNDVTSLRHGLVAGEALTPALLEEWRRRTGRALYEALGMSEISTYISTAPGMEIRPGSPGKPQPGRRIAILPEDPGDPHAAEPLPSGEVGLLAVHRSDPGLMLGYWKRPEEEAAVYRGEWFVGGDRAALDEDGYLWFHGRADDLMNPMGYRVGPLEVEAVLAEHPAIAEVAVTGLEVRPQVTVVAAFVVPQDGIQTDREEIMAWARDRLASYKCPREIVFVEALPRTANGKVLRRALPDLVMKDPAEGAAALAQPGRVLR